MVDADSSAFYDFSVYFLDGTKLFCETLFVKTLESPVTGDALKQFLLECLRSLDLLDEHDIPRLSIWGVSDAGANIVCALKLLKEAGIIEGWHNCFKHELQLVIQDGIKTTTGGCSH